MANITLSGSCKHSQSKDSSSPSFDYNNAVQGVYAKGGVGTSGVSRLGRLSFATNGNISGKYITGATLRITYSDGGQNNTLKTVTFYKDDNGNKSDTILYSYATVGYENTDTLTFSSGSSLVQAIQEAADTDSTYFRLFIYSGETSTNHISYNDSSYSYSTNYAVIGDSGAAYLDIEYSNTPPTYTVTYDANGGTGAPSSQTKNHGTALTLSSTKPTKASTTSTSSSTITITYNKNGGSTTPGSGTGTRIVTTTTPYTFSNWNTNSNGTGTSYSAGASYTADASVTLYAQYTPGSPTTSATNPNIKTAAAISRANASAGSYTVTFNANGGSCSTSSLSAARTTSYSFNKWNTNSYGTGQDYSANTSYTFSANTTLYAIWNPSTTTASITLPTATKSGYAFKGWSTSSSATSGVTGSYTPTGNVTLYAVWEQDSYTYTIQFNGNGYTGGSLPSSISKSGTSTSVVMGDIGNSVPTKTGYVFRGWSASSSYSYTKRIVYNSTANYGGGEDYNGYSPTVTQSSWTYATYCTNTGGNSSNRTLTLYAQWEKQRYTIKFEDNIQNSTFENVVEYEKSITLPTRSTVTTNTDDTTLYHTLNNSPIIGNDSKTTKKTTYTKRDFLGWVYNGTLYEGGKSVTVTGDMTYTASYGDAYENNVYTYFTLPSYSTQTVETTIVTTLDYQNSYFINAQKNTTIITTHTHNNWTDNTIVYDKESSVQPTSETTFYSNWDTETNVESFIPKTPDPSQLNGYTFAGWFTEPNGQGENVTSGYAPTENTTIYAYWEVKNYITTVIRYTTELAKEHNKVFYYHEEKWHPIETIKVYENGQWVQVGEQIPYISE